MTTTSNVQRSFAIAPWRRGYSKSWLSKDVIGGLSAGAVVIPQAMAYATIAHLPVQYGLYTCMVPMVIYALLGGSRTMSVSTTSTVAVLTASALIAAGVVSQSDDPSRELAALTIFVGVILVVARLLKLGSLIDNISGATLTGVKTGVGLTVAAAQLPKALGIPGDPSADNFVADVRVIFRQISDVSVTTMVFSICTLVVLLGLKRFAPKFPGPLVAVVGGIVVASLANLDQHGVALIAPVPSGLPTPVAPAWDHIRALTPSAFAIAIMVFLESVSVARSVRRQSEPPIDNDDELVAAGAAAIVGGFFRSMPPAGGFSQTAINQSAGARTQLSELVTAVLAVACALFLGTALSKLPEATLGCLVLVAVIGLVKPSEFARLWRFNRVEFWVAVITAVAGLLLGLLAAVFVGVVLTLFLVLRGLDRIGITELQPTRDGTDINIAGDGTRAVDGLLILRVDGPLYTANIRVVNQKILAALDARAGEAIRVVAVDLTSVPVLTTTVLDEARQLDHELSLRNVSLWLTSISPAALDAMDHTARWHEVMSSGRVHTTTLAAVHAFEGNQEPG